MYLPEALRCVVTITLGSKSLSEEEEAIGPEGAQKEGYTYTAVQD